MIKYERKNIYSKFNVMELMKDIVSRTSHSVEYLVDENIENTLSLNGIRIRKIIAPLLRLVYLTQTKYSLIIDNRIKLSPSKKGRIFAINHRQGDDIVLGANAVGESGYIVFGNPYLAFETTNGLGLWAYGMILLQRDIASSRKSAYEKMKFVIEHGGNIIIYPEGYWNLCDDGKKDARHGADGHKSDNWLIQDVNLGIFRLARETGCEIVPTILHYDEHMKKRCYAYRGDSFEVKDTDDFLEKKNEFMTIMNTMYFSLMEKYSTYKRADIEKEKSLKEQWATLVKELVADCDINRIGYHLDLKDEKEIGKAKVIQPICTPEEAFAAIEALKV